MVECAEDNAILVYNFSLSLISSHAQHSWLLLSLGTYLERINTKIINETGAIQIFLYRANNHL